MGDAVDVDERHVRPFNEFLAQQAKGATHAELSEKLNELLTAVVDQGKQGTLTLKLTVKPANTVGTHAVFITDEITMKAPQGARPTSMFFVDSDGNATRNDPNQLEIPAMTVVDGQAGKEASAQ